MSTGRFRFAADILRRLGEELNPSPDQGILELVKNAYDADARQCRIELIDTDEPGGTVRITDDGDGMTADGIANGWLVLGKSPKNPLKLTRLRRHPAGSKGLGRLAALRMGTRATLTTRPRVDPAVEYSLAIDWTKFDGVAIVDDVPLSIRHKDALPKSKSGTTIAIDDLRTRVGRMDVK